MEYLEYLRCSIFRQVDSLEFLQNIFCYFIGNFTGLSLVNCVSHDWILVSDWIDNPYHSSFGMIKASGIFTSFPHHISFDFDDKVWSKKIINCLEARTENCTLQNNGHLQWFKVCTLITLIKVADLFQLKVSGPLGCHHFCSNSKFFFKMELKYW